MLNPAVTAYLKSKALKEESAPVFSHIGAWPAAHTGTFHSFCNGIGPNVTYFITDSGKVFAAFLHDWEVHLNGAIGWLPDVGSVLFTDTGLVCQHNGQPSSWVRSNKFPSVFGLGPKGPYLQTRKSSTFPNWPPPPFPQQEVSYTLREIRIFRVVIDLPPLPPIAPTMRYTLLAKTAMGATQPFSGWARLEYGVAELFSNTDAAAIEALYASQSGAVVRLVDLVGTADVGSMQCQMVGGEVPIFRVVGFYDDPSTPNHRFLLTDTSACCWEVETVAGSQTGVNAIPRPEEVEQCLIDGVDFKPTLPVHTKLPWAGRNSVLRPTGGLPSIVDRSDGKVDGRFLVRRIAAYASKVALQGDESSDDASGELEEAEEDDDQDDSKLHRANSANADEEVVADEARDGVLAWNAPLSPELLGEVTKVINQLASGRWLAALELLESECSRANGMCALKADLCLFALLDGQLLHSSSSATSVVYAPHTTKIANRIVAASSSSRGSRRLFPFLKNLLFPAGADAAPAYAIHNVLLRDHINHRLTPERYSLHDRWITELRGFTHRKSFVEQTAPSVKPNKTAVPKPTSNSPQPLPGAAPRALDTMWTYEGMDHVLSSVATLIEAQRVVKLQGAKMNVGHFQFLGNPGTGKTVMAELLGRLLAEEGFLPAGAAYEQATGTELVTAGVQEFQKRIGPLVSKGILFIDEVYQLQPQSNPVGRQITDILMQKMEAHRESFVVIVAGYKKDVDHFLSFNPGLPSRFRHVINFLDFDDLTLRNIFLKQLSSIHPKFRVDNEETLLVAIKRLASMRGTVGFGNARDVRRVVEAAHHRQAARIARKQPPIKASSKMLFTLARVDVLGEVDALRLNPWPALQELDALVGIKAVKNRIFEDIIAVVRNSEREMNGLAPLEFYYNRCFYGPQGVGKTTVGKLYARILCDLGIVDDPVPVEKTPKDLLSPAVGESAKNVVSLIESSLGKVIFLDEAYQINDGSPHGKDMADALVTKVEPRPTFRPIVVSAGYTKEMLEMFRTMNPGLARRLNPGDRPYEFTTYSAEELHIVFRRCVEKKSNTACSREVADEAVQLLARDAQKPNFGNVGAAEALFSAALTKAVARCAKSNIPLCIAKEDLAVTREEDLSVDEVLNRNPGLQTWYARELRYQRRMERVGQAARLVGHFLFLGNPGTGKSTAARALGTLCSKLKLTPGSSFVETTPSKMQTGFVGQAGLKAREVLESALGGILLVDEAYTMRDGFGRQVLDEIVAALEEEKFKGKLVVVLAGYEAPVRDMLDSNEGAKSRFPNIIKFADFSSVDCARLFIKQWNSFAVSWGETEHDGDFSSHPAVLKLFDEMIRLVSGWANARDVNNFVDFCLHELDEESSTLSLEDFTNLARQFTSSRPHPHGARSVTEPQGPTQSAEAPGQAENVRQMKALLKQLTDSSEAASEAPRAVTVAEDETPESTFETYILALGARIQQFRQSQDDADKIYLAALEEELRQALATQKAIEEELAAAKAKSDAQARRRAEAAAKKEQEALKLKMKLDKMGLCPAGFTWRRHGQGWICGGGSHQVTDDQLRAGHV
jgi:SpoVK/Ycf46/Vps4 family AAA+-type ATPase